MRLRFPNLLYILSVRLLVAKQTHNAMFSDSRFRHLNCTQGETDYDDGRSIIQNQFGENSVVLPEYPYNCVSYDPLKCLGKTVEQMLDTRLKFVRGKSTAEVFEVKDGSSGKRA